MFFVALTPAMDSTFLLISLLSSSIRATSELFEGRVHVKLVDNDAVDSTLVVVEITPPRVNGINPPDDLVLVLVFTWEVL